MVVGVVPGEQEKSWQDWMFWLKDDDKDAATRRFALFAATAVAVIATLGEIIALLEPDDPANVVKSLAVLVGETRLLISALKLGGTGMFSGDR